MEEWKIIIVLHAKLFAAMTRIRSCFVMHQVTKIHWCFALCHVTKVTTLECADRKSKLSERKVQWPIEHVPIAKVPQVASHQSQKVSGTFQTQCCKMSQKHFPWLTTKSASVLQVCNTFWQWACHFVQASAFHFAWKFSFNPFVLFPKKLNAVGRFEFHCFFAHWDFNQMNCFDFEFLHSLLWATLHNSWPTCVTQIKAVKNSRKIQNKAQMRFKRINFPLHNGKVHKRTSKHKNEFSTICCKTCHRENFCDTNAAKNFGNFGLFHAQILCSMLNLFSEPGRVKILLQQVDCTASAFCIDKLNFRTAFEKLTQKFLDKQQLENTVWSLWQHNLCQQTVAKSVLQNEKLQKCFGKAGWKWSDVACGTPNWWFDFKQLHNWLDKCALTIIFWHSKGLSSCLHHHDSSHKAFFGTLGQITPVASRIFGTILWWLASSRVCVLFPKLWKGPVLFGPDHRSSDYEFLNSTDDSNLANLAHTTIISRVV